jgi:succinoglycan biosynthesis protein ExoA
MSIETQTRVPIREILIVVPTLNEVRGIEAVVDALRQGWPANLQGTLVVADGGSSDGTVELVQRMAASRPWLRLLANPQRIQSAAVNLAARTLGQNAQVLVRCDAHAVYPGDFVARLLQSLEQTGADAVVVPMDSVGEGCFQRAVAWVSDSRVGSGGSAHRGGRRSGYVDHGHHAAFRMESFLRAGGYDESFTHNEDAELDCRQRKLGSRLYLDADIRLQYHPRATPGRLARQYFAYGRGRSRTVRRHPKSMRARQLALPLNLVLLVVALALAPWWPVLLLWPAMYLGVLALSSVSIAWQKRSRCGLLAGLAAMIMHVAWAAGFLWGMALVREAPWRAEDALPLVPQHGGMK